MDGNVPTLTTLRVAALRVWPDNPRRTVPPLDDLAASIRRLGVLSPLLVRPLAEPIEEGHESGGREGWVVDRLVTHEVIDGQCRYLAAGLAGLDEVPVNVRAIDDATALELAMAGNVGRNDAPPLDDAEALNALVTRHGRTPEQVADAIGRPVQWVRRRLSLLALCGRARKMLAAGDLPLAHAHQLAAVDHGAQEAALDRYKHGDLPTAKVFAGTVAAALRTLASAPFDTRDAKLPGGACDGCAKRTDAQRDLFGDVSAAASCTDRPCWDAKVAASWDRAVKAAKKRRLAVVAEPVDLAWDHGVKVDGRELTVRSRPGASPVAVARTPWGKVVDLYEPPPGGVSGDASAEPDGSREVDEAEERELEAAEAERRAGRERAKAEAKAAKLATLSRLLDALSGDDAGRAAGFRVALLTCARDLEMGCDLRDVMEARGAGAVAFSTDADLVADLPDCDLAAVLAAVICAAWALDKDADDATNYERSLRGLLAAPAVAPAAGGCADCAEAKAILRPGERATCVCGRVHAREADPDDNALGMDLARDRFAASEPFGPEDFGGSDYPDHLPMPIVPDRAVTASNGGPVTRLWIAEAAWDSLNQDARDDLAEPFGGATVEWKGTEGFVYADVPAELLATVRGLVEAFDVAAHEGAERPAAAPAALLRVRAVLVTEAGDWMKCRKGLAAWAAEKTPGAGALSGGSNSPLVLLWTPAVASPDVAKLFAKLAKEKRRHLDLGEVPAATVHDFAPSNRAVRERWNDAHPEAKVDAGGAKGGRK